MTSNQTTPLFMGIDIGKSHLDIAVRPTAEHWQVDNDSASIANLVEKVRLLAPVLIVLEATGGYETHCAAGLAAEGWPVAVINPRQARDFAKSTGHLAKTGKVDGAVLAHFAEAIRPEPRPLADEQTSHLQVVIARRRQLIEMLVAEKNRLSVAATELKPRLVAC
jgi:transposase